MHKPLLIAHRGDATNFLENTIEAFQSALSLGADGIECDIQLNQNSEVIVVHNYIHDETKIYPLFSKVLENFSTKGRLEIEIKSLDPVCVESVAAVIRKYNPTNYEITSSVLPMLPIIRKFLPEAKVGMIFHSKFFEEWMSPEFILKFLLSYMKLTSANVLHLDLDRYTPEIVKEFHSHNYILHSHLKTAEIAEYEKAQKLGIDQCTFDDINLLKIIP